MGMFDTLIDGKNQAQIKCLDCQMNVIKPGSKVKLKGVGYYREYEMPKSFTIILPVYEEQKYAIFKNGKFIKLTNNKKEIVKPYYDKYGIPQ